MKFSATLRGVAYGDPKEFAAAVKAGPDLLTTKTRKARNAQERRTADWRGEITVPTRAMPAHLPPVRVKVFEKPRVTLTAAEQEWLGATVRRSDGLVAQVWSLAPSRPGAPTGLWLVANGDYVRAEVNDVTVVQSRADQLDV
jgi:hypothetical protein